MQAAVLVGGAGTRLCSLTRKVPKPMVPVRGRPFLLYVLEVLRKEGVDDVVLCIGHLGEQVPSYFGDGRALGLRLRYSQEEGELLGTGGALKRAEAMLGEWFFVVYGDTYLPVPYHDVAAAFLAGGKPGLMVVYDNQEDTDVKNNVALDGDLMVVRYEKDGPQTELRYVEAGVSVFRREVVALMEADRACSLEEEVYPRLIQRQELAAYPFSGRFYDIGTPARLRAFQAFVQAEEGR